MKRKEGQKYMYNCIIRRWEKSVNENRVLRVNESQDRRKKGNRGACNCPPPHCVLKWVLRGHFLGIKMPQ